MGLNSVAVGCLPCRLVLVASHARDLLLMSLVMLYGCWPPCQEPRGPTEMYLGKSDQPHCGPLPIIPVHDDQPHCGPLPIIPVRDDSKAEREGSFLSSLSLYPSYLLAKIPKP